MKHINDNILNVCPKIIRRLDKWGRIILLKEFRKNLKWEEKDLIDIYLYENDYIVMKKRKYNVFVMNNINSKN